MDRQPVVAGRFYPADPGGLGAEVRAYLDRADKPGAEPTLLAMAPHAGYIFSGAVAGRTLGAANLAPTVLLLGPNHTGQGLPLSVWPEGRWHYPGGALSVDGELAAALIKGAPALGEDTDAHLMEHSLEVLVPFLASLNSDTSIVPVAVAEPRFEALEETARGMAAVLAERGGPVSVVVSSDMSHFVSAERARELDELALAAVLDMDPRGLIRVVREQNITMCGVLPMALGLMTVRALGATRASLVQYTNSGEISGDFDQVVGYAGVLVH